MKTVFTHAQCAHVWAQQSQPNGKTSAKRIFFEGATIYSYGYHFAMATFLRPDLVLINSDRYSVSTSKHQGYVYSAVNHIRRVYAPNAVVKSAVSYHDDAANRIPAMLRAYVEYAETQTECAIESAAQIIGNKRLKKRVAKIIDAAKSIVDDCEKFHAEFNQTIPATLSQRKEAFSKDYADVIQGFAAQKEKERIAKAKKDAAHKRKLEKALPIAAEKWRSFEEQTETEKAAMTFARYSNFVFMRLMPDNETIETNLGARFPVKHGAKAFEFIRKWKEKKVPGAWVKNGKTIHLGAFEIDMIDSDGSVKAGCHTVQWAEIERLARQLEIYP